MATQRNRSEGWKHAKISGHNNEELIAELTKNNKDIQQKLLQTAGLSDMSVIDVGYGGLNEKDIASVFGDKTKSKTDMWLELSNGQRLNISLKKDEGGQVFLIGIDRFIEGFEIQYNSTIPQNVKRAITLFFGSASDVLSIVNSVAGNYKGYELRKHRIVAETLKQYNEDLYNVLLNWINNNMSEIFDFCFSRGLAANKEDWAQILWYKNMVGENEFDLMFYLPNIERILPRNAEYGNRGGGTTIQLPFGFVQWHSPRKIIPGNIQFHHSYQKIALLK